MTAFDMARGVVKRGFPEPRGPFDHPKDPESIPDWWLDMTPEEQDAFVESERQTAEEQRMFDAPRCDNCGTTEGVENKGHQTGGASYWACGPTDSCGKNKKLREGESQ